LVGYIPYDCENQDLSTFEVWKYVLRDLAGLPGHQVGPNRYEECVHANEMTTTTKPQRWIENVVLEELIKSIEALRLKITLRIRLNLFKE
jgi:hypothetical protein